MLRFDEFEDILSQQGREHVIKAQCPFGSASQKLTSWVTSRVSFAEIMDLCPHQATRWYMEGIGGIVDAKKVPSYGTARCCKDSETARMATVSKDADYVSTQLAAYPLLLNRHMAFKVKLAPAKVTNSHIIPPPPVHAWDERLTKEQVELTQPLRGHVDTPAKEQQEPLAVGVCEMPTHRSSVYLM